MMRAEVEVGHLGVVLVDEVVEDVIHLQLQLVFLEEGEDLLDGQPLLDVLLRPPQEDLQNLLAGDQVLLLLGSQQLS